MIQLRISGQVYSAVVILAVVAFVAAGMGVKALTSYKAVVDEMGTTSHSAVLSERVNGLVLSVVMDSRGIYMAQSKAEAEKYAVPLLKTLDLLRATLKDWRAQVPAARRGRFADAEQAAEDFIRFRTELVRLSREVGLAEARGFGDNDANRKARSALNERIKLLAEETDSEVNRLSGLVQTSYGGNRNSLIAVLVIGLGLGLATAVYVVSTKIVMPLGVTTGVMNGLAKGDLSLPIPFLNRKDEIGEMAASLDHFKSQLIHGKEMEAEARVAQEQELDRGRRRDHLTVEFDAVIGRVMIDVDGTVRKVHATSSSLHLAAEEASKKSSMVAASAKEASSNIQTVASAAEELSASIQEISQRVQTTTGITREAVNGVLSADTTVGGLFFAAQKIGEVVSLINAIAAQTNLLALNATIEAARAGEAGKGFAVVANEVKTLATQTAKATSEIAEQIIGIQTATQDAVKAIKMVGAAVNRVDEEVSSIAAAVEQQGAATQEIVRNIHEASEGNNNVALNIIEVSTAVSATGDLASSMFEVAQVLEESGTGLDAEVKKFLADVKAA